MGDLVNTYITFIKIRMTQSTKYTNQELLQCLIDLIKFSKREKYQKPQN